MEPPPVKAVPVGLIAGSLMSQATASCAIPKIDSKKHLLPYRKSLRPIDPAFDSVTIRRDPELGVLSALLTSSRVSSRGCYQYRHAGIIV